MARYKNNNKKLACLVLTVGMSMMMVGCAVTEPVQPEARIEPIAIAATNTETAQSASVDNAQPVVAQPQSDAMLARGLIGTAYERKRGLPKTIGDDWKVSTAIKLAGKEKSDFLAIMKDDTLVLMHATSQAQPGPAGNRYVIRDAWAVARHEKLMQAACLPLVKGKSPIFALIHRGAVDEIVLAAHVVPGTDQIAGIDAKTSTPYRCRYRAGRTGVVKRLAW